MNEIPVFDTSRFGSRVLNDEYGVAESDGVFDDTDTADGE